MRQTNILFPPPPPLRRDWVENERAHPLSPQPQRGWGGCHFTCCATRLLTRLQQSFTVSTRMGNNLHFKRHFDPSTFYLPDGANRGQLFLLHFSSFLSLSPASESSSPFLPLSAAAVSVPDPSASSSSFIFLSSASA